MPPASTRSTIRAVSDVAPRFAGTWAAAVYALCALALGWPALLGRFLANPYSDEYIAGYAFREFGASALRATGEFPLWNPFLMGGVPFVAGMGGDIFYPTFLLRMIVPTDVAITWTFIIHIFVAGMATYAFLRAWGLGFYPALFGGVAYMLSGPIAGLASPGHDGKLYVSALFPITLLLLLRGIRDARAWAWGVLALVVGLGVLSPHPQLLQYLLLASGAFALYLAFGTHDGIRLDRGVAFRRLGAGLGTVVLGFLIGAIQYVPVREYVEWSPRAGGRGYEYATSFSMPFEELINAYLPQFTGMLEAYWGRNPIHLHSDYVGVVVLIAAAAAFGGTALTAHRRSFRWFWAGTLVVALLWALGGNTPFYRLVYAIVPGTKFFRAPSTILFVVSFAVAVLAALGVERILAREVRERYAVGWVVAGVVVAILGVTGGLTSLATAIADPRLYDFVQANQEAVAVGALRSLLFVALGAGIVFAAAKGKLSRQAIGIGLVVVAAADLWTILRQYWMFDPPAAVVYASDPTIEYLKNLEQPSRVLARPLSAEMARRDPFLMGDALMSHDVRQTLGYHGNELGRYQILSGKDQGYATALQNPNFWALTNTRFLLTNAEVPDLERLVGPVRNAAGTNVYLYDLPGDQPFAWVAPVAITAPDDAVLATVLDPRFDVTRAALFDTSAAVPAVSTLDSLPAPLPTTVEVIEYEPGHIAMRLDGPVPEGSALVVSENYYPGWRATVDGRPAPVGRADYVLIGVPLPAGAKRVELSFESGAFETGKAITLVAIGLSLLLAIGGFVLDRKRRA